VSDRPAVGAAVDLGSNSVHLLVAEIAGHELRPLVDESVFLGLGAAVDERAHLGAARREELVEALVRYAATAQQLGATHITFMGTEPIRRAADAARIQAEVEHATGVPVHVLSHEEEAYLTLVGVTSGQPVKHETLVVDIGGGSSEFCAVAAGGIARAAGLRLGSNSLSTRYARHDPPTPDELQAMTRAADQILQDALQAEPTDLTLVGGTASNLLKVTAAGPADRDVTSERVAEALTALRARSAAETTERFGVNPTRARLLPAGAVIVEALMRRYGVDRVRVSEAGMREGAILVAHHAGRAWRDRLAELAHGWRR
jgi:exopolyphosphatase / guanosine-5'-triphosphate,3'-diphosphate pyrophosphatase